MDAFDLGWLLPEPLYTGGRQHRYMESADINAAFDELYRALRASIRRGCTVRGNIYGLEMDACIPGQLLGSTWIRPDRCDWLEPRRLVSRQGREQAFRELAAQRGDESMFVYVCERNDLQERPVLLVELWSADGLYQALMPIKRDGERSTYDLLRGEPHLRCNSSAASRLDGRPR